MLRYRGTSTGSLKRLRTNQDGVVSLEYVMLAACVVGSASAAFGTGSGGAVASALASVIGTISTAIGS